MAKKLFNHNHELDIMSHSEHLHLTKLLLTILE